MLSGAETADGGSWRGHDLSRGTDVACFLFWVSSAPISKAQHFCQSDGPTIPFKEVVV